MRFHNKYDVTMGTYDVTILQCFVTWLRVR